MFNKMCCWTTHVGPKGKNNEVDTCLLFGKIWIFLHFIKCSIMKKQKKNNKKTNTQTNKKRHRTRATKTVCLPGCALTSPPPNPKDRFLYIKLFTFVEFPLFDPKQSWKGFMLQSREWSKYDTLFYYSWSFFSYGLVEPTQRARFQGSCCRFSYNVLCQDWRLLSFKTSTKVSCLKQYCMLLVP